MKHFNKIQRFRIYAGSLVLESRKNDIDGTAELGREHIPNGSGIAFYPERNEEILKDFTCEMAWSDTL